MHSNPAFKKWFMVTWGTLAILWSVVVLVAGEFTYGKGRSARLITPANEPWMFWLTILGVAAVGVAVALFGLCVARPKSDSTADPSIGGNA